MTGDGGSELENGNKPKPEVKKTHGDSEGSKKPSTSSAFREAVGRAKTVLLNRLGKENPAGEKTSDEAKLRVIAATPEEINQIADENFSDEAKRKVKAAAPEGFKLLTNELRFDPESKEGKIKQDEYVGQLRENNEVFIGEAFDREGNLQPDSIGIYIRPKTDAY